MITLLLYQIIRGVLVAAATSIVLLVVWIFHCRWEWWMESRRRCHGATGTPTVIAFYHPYCAAGGGGERVLWKMVQALEERWGNGSINDTSNQEKENHATTTETNVNQKKSHIHIVIYTIDPPRENYLKDLMEHVQSRFDIVLTGSIPISFVHLHPYKHLLQPARYFSLLVESLGTMRLAYHALRLHATTWSDRAVPLPRLYIDTTGCAFTYLVPKLLVPQCHIMPYVHYPTISTDMLQLVYQRRPSYNHNVDLAKSALSTYLKLSYYCLFAMAYGVMGSLADLVLVNSTWTFQHIVQLWGWIDGFMSLIGRSKKSQERIQIIFPPCNVARLNHLPLEDRIDPTNKKGRELGWIVSIGQFRPEKDHPLQLRALALLLQQHPELKEPPFSVRLVLIGSCRSGTEDERRVEELRTLAQTLNVADHVVWVLNQSTTVIVDDWLSRASIGIHSMWNEHFGIAIVEMMAAGLVMIAHNSGGPQTDIIGPFSSSNRNGFLASTVEEYAQVLHQVLTMSETERLQIRTRARESVERFSDQVFVNSFQKAMIQSGLLGDANESAADTSASRKED